SGTVGASASENSSSPPNDGASTVTPSSVGHAQTWRIPIVSQPSSRVRAATGTAISGTSTASGAAMTAATRGALGASGVVTAATAALGASIAPNAASSSSSPNSARSSGAAGSD